MELELEFLNLSERNPRILPKNAVTICYGAAKTRRLTFSAAMTETLREAGLNFLRVGLSKVSKDVYFMFCKKPTQDSMNLDTSKKRMDVNGKFLVEKIVEHLGLPKKNQTILLSDNVANSTEYMTFRIEK